MARKLRVQIPGGTYHVTSRGVAGNPLYRSSADREVFLAALARTVARHDWACHAYCLMTTHYHLVVHTPDPNLAVGMKWLNAAYARRFNWKYAMRGHVFESRYASVLVEREPHLLELARYVALNPVRAGICIDPADWPWSSYRAWMGLSSCPPFLTPGWLLSHFGTDPDRARARLQLFVLDGSPHQSG
jgi:putative transposase